ncbi:metallophosphoesterase 1 [Paramormyrops kingsleyae]|uniref:Metallophosphoesterase 1 n=1 Tax=Paramormyrops kingsleyae TaxID=1676925 RepID=A0A3B3S6D0_9TELE|nr:metallophosphoesterase 1 [Paramormyrops kingsleyae]
MPILEGRRGAVILSALSIISVFVFCEYIIYYPTILQCHWPRGHEEDGVPALRVLFLADTHLLGAIRGHWFDKLRREWQMERAFQTALWLLQPEIVFILGDIFDEGKWSSRQDWKHDVQRFLRMFRHPGDTELIVLVGNHDVGFHYEMNRYKLDRFERLFNYTSAKILSRKGVNFVLVNSVAMQGDGCSICQAVEDQLLRLSQDLNCSLQGLPSYAVREQCRGRRSLPPSAPILLQHYPLYRVSDASCSGKDVAPPEERHLLFKERYDVLSREASKKLLRWFHPRLILSGHTHSACEVLHEQKYPEISVPSFSWRNRNDPSFILGTISPRHFALHKCFLPEESTVIGVYCATSITLALVLAVHSHSLRAGKLKSP